MNLRELLLRAEIYIEGAEAESRRCLGPAGWTWHGEWVLEYLTAMRRSAVDLLERA